MKTIITAIAIGLSALTAQAQEVVWPLGTNITFLGVNVDSLAVDRVVNFDLPNATWRVQAKPIGAAPTLQEVEGAKVDYAIRTEMELVATRAEVAPHLGMTEQELATNQVIRAYFDAVAKVLTDKAAQALKEKE